MLSQIAPFSRSRARDPRGLTSSRWTKGNRFAVTDCLQHATSGECWIPVSPPPPHIIDIIIFYHIHRFQPIITPIYFLHGRSGLSSLFRRPRSCILTRPRAGCAALRNLLKLKEWLTVPDAARHLSILFGEEVGDTNLSCPAERVVAFYNQCGTCEPWIKEGKGAIKWTRLSCRTFAANAVRLQLRTLGYNLGNFLRALATPEPISDLEALPDYPRGQTGKAANH